MTVIGSITQADPLTATYQGRTQTIKEIGESMQSIEQELFSDAKPLLLKIAEYYDKAIQKYDETLAQVKKNYDSRSWISLGLFPKAWTGLRLALISKPTEVSLSKLDPSYDYNNYENTKFYNTLRLLQNAGLIWIHEEVHP